MTGPKHLWSGDWESESARPADDLATAPRLVFDPEPEPEPEPRASATRRWSRRQLVIALVTGVAAAAVTVGVVTAFNGSNHKPKAHNIASASRHAGAPTPGPTGGAAPVTKACQQTPAACTTVTPVSTGPTANWMGMQIVSSSGGVVISTVRLGSIADQAGFEPGDQIEQINGHQVSNMDQVRDATAGIAIGKPMSIEVLRNSASYAASVPLTERPSIHP